MKYSLIILILLIPRTIFCDISITSGFINDNYTGSTKNGINGNYIGADDFLTLSLFVQSEIDNLSISEYYQVVTSRKFGFRYDLLTTTSGYNIYVNNFTFKPSFSLLLKGDMNGNIVQNEFHRFRKLPLLILPYSDRDIGISFNFSGLYEKSNLIVTRDKFSGILRLEVPSGIKPISLDLNIEYCLDFDYISLSTATGYKHYLSSVQEYSEFLGPGIIGGAQIIFKIFKEVKLNSGIYFFPSENLKNDPLYLDKTHNYSPQIWVSIGFGYKDFSILDIITL